ncbi:alpha/beta hydrolase [Ktedonosporobacter rubrisoli]|uniref:Alpha/beta hydrolase n=1 Tax=Ktedonosporobacter rubrisoli TaxID=2509675 RepID=A0A4P6JWV7_KTERU|nr:alpha/beta hydrolase [Ktedonosporobacter rubrisoli]QBD80207.1 alpha/beta hydrolase [Ktedonosporobacter rubrisoli]
MHKKPLLFLATTVSTVAASLYIARQYQSWQRREIARVQAESSLIDTALGQVEYRKEGHGPALLIIHGTPGGYDQSILLARLLGGHDFTLIAPSRPGYLRTPATAGRKPEEQADLLAALLDALHLQKAIVLAISGGGPCALQFALRHPERCSGLIAISAITRRYTDEEERKGWPLYLRILKYISDRLLLLDPVLYPLVVLAGWLPGAKSPADMLRTLMLNRLRKAGYKIDMEQFALMPAYPLEKISAPTFILHGTADTDVPFEHGELLASRLPHAHFMALKNAGHTAFWTRQEQVIPALRSFLHGLN